MIYQSSALCIEHSLFQSEERRQSKNATEKHKKPTLLYIFPLTDSIPPHHLQTYSPSLASASHFPLHISSSGCTIRPVDSLRSTLRPYGILAASIYRLDFLFCVCASPTPRTRGDQQCRHDARCLYDMERRQWAFATGEGISGCVFLDWKCP